MFTAHVIGRLYWSPIYDHRRQESDCDRPTLLFKSPAQSLGFVTHRPMKDGRRAGRCVARMRDAVWIDLSGECECVCVCECVDGWLKQPHLARVSLHTCRALSTRCNRLDRSSPRTLRERSPAWQRGAPSPWISRRVSDRLRLSAGGRETREHLPDLVRNTPSSHHVKTDTGALLVV